MIFCYQEILWQIKDIPCVLQINPFTIEQTWQKPWSSIKYYDISFLRWICCEGYLYFSCGSNAIQNPCRIYVNDFDRPSAVLWQLDYGYLWTKRISIPDQLPISADLQGRDSHSLYNPHERAGDIGFITPSGGARRHKNYLMQSTWSEF